MKTQHNFSKRSLVALALPVAAALSANATAGDGPCTAIALQALRSCQLESLGSYWLARGVCTNLPDPADRVACTMSALQELEDRREECREILASRLDVCDQLGEDRYNPVLDPNDFGPIIDNMYRPFLPGTTYVYEKDAGGEIEVIEVTVLEDTKEILGIECTVVHDVVTIDGELVEDTLDWFAQDNDGNVWYLGEIAKNYEDGDLSDLDGSWVAGKNDAQPGILVEGLPVIGNIYRQEYLLREAEDIASVLSLNETVTVQYGTFTDCLLTEDFTPLSPDSIEHKYYAPGIGVVLEIDLTTGERLELVDIITR